MKSTDDREGRLRKLLSALRRIQAPADFEEQLARRLARGRARATILPAWLRPYTVPGLALLLVGAMSYVIYLAQFKAVDGDRSPSGDTMTIPPVRSGPEKALPDELRPSIPAHPETQRRTGTASRPGARADDEMMNAPVDIRPRPSTVPPAQPGKGDVRPAEKMKLGKSEPDRSLMMEQTVVDTALAPPDSLRDSTRIPNPD